MNPTGDEAPPLLSNPVLLNGTVTPLTLTSTGELQWTEGDIPRSLIVEKEVLGFSADGPKIKIRTAIADGDPICCFWSRPTPLRKTFVFEPLTGDSLRLWSQTLQSFIDSLGRPKKLLVFVNPFGGKRSASKIFIDDVKPLLEDANVEFTLHETRYQLHAKEVVQTLDLSKFDGIVCVSGDGILVEVVNGLLEREDWESAIKMPLGVVPAGTGNGMAKSLLDSVDHPCTAFNAVLAIIQGHKRSLDVATMSQGDTRFFSVLMLAWGLIADIDIESEKYRWMGSFRNDFQALQRLIRLRKYNGCISFAPAPGFEGYGEPIDPIGEHSNKYSINPSHDRPIDGRQFGYGGPDIDLENLSWRKINGPFISVWLHNVPWGGEQTKAAPDAKFSDGYYDLIITKNCPRLGLLSLMTELNTGDHVKSPHVLYLKVKAFVLEPGPRVDDLTKEGIIDVDGEVLARGKGAYKCEQTALMAYDKLQVAVHQGLATIFTPI